jgi:glycosyltransferase involved in cell wall biosynthesis
MQWLILTDDFPPCDGGVATWTSAVARGLVAAGDRVTVLARARPGLGAVDADGVEVVPMRFPSFGRWGSVPLGVASLRWRPDAVLATTWTVARVAAPLARARGIPLHIVAHGSDVTLGLNGAFDATVRDAQLWAVSEFLAVQVRSRGYRCRVLPAPVDALEAVRPRDRCAHWLFVGRATPRKGGDRFVRWVAAAGVEGTVIGDGPEILAWQSIAVECGARVRFTGRLAHAAVNQVYAAADLVVLAPRADTDGVGAEGLGLTLLEAAAVGVPGVGCRTGGVPEAVGPGLLVDEPDDAEACVAQIAAWWTPERGMDAYRALSAAHGVKRTVAALREWAR